MGFFDAILNPVQNFRDQWNAANQPAEGAATGGFQAVAPQKQPEQFYQNNDNAYSYSEPQQGQADPLDQPFRSNAGGFAYPQDDTPAMKQVRSYFQEPDVNVLGGALDFNTAPKGNNAVNVQPEEAAPETAKPQVNPALSGLPPAMKGETSEVMPPQRSGIATGDNRDQLLRMAGLPTDSDRAVSDSKFRQAQKTTEVGGRMLPNPAEPGIDPVERARRYEAIVAADPNSEKGKFARNELFQISKDPVQAAALKNAVSGERMTNAAEAAAQNQADEKAKWEAEFGLKKAADTRAAELQPLEKEAKQVELGVAKGTAGDRVKKAQLDNELSQADRADKASNAEIRRENYKLDKEKFTNVKEQQAQEDFFKVADNFDKKMDKAIDDADKVYQEALKGSADDMFGLGPAAIKQNAEKKRDQVIANAVASAATLAKAHGLDEKQFSEYIKRNVPQLQGMPPSQVKQIMNFTKQASGIVKDVASLINPLAGI